MASEAAGARVWIRDGKLAWVRGVLESREETKDGKWKFVVRKEPRDEGESDNEDNDEEDVDETSSEDVVEILGESKELSQHNDIFLCNQFEDARTLADVEDLTRLTHLHEPSILQSLNDRFKNDNIYTNTGPILLAVNPFKQLRLYSPDLLEMYYSTGLLRSQGLEAPQMAPHVFATGDAAYRNLVDTMDQGAKNQSILVSGESGAGKTESTKYIMKYLATVARDADKSGGEQIADMVLQSNPILEAFGNARTNRNDNSSRFGKFIEMQFSTDKHRLVGARIVTYLLEKVRLAKQGLGERNFHVFYQLCRGASEEQLEAWHVPDLEACGITNQSECFDRRDGVDDESQFQHMWKAMETMGFEDDEKAQLMRTVSAVMNLGNLRFVPDVDGKAAGDEDEAATLDQTDEVSKRALAACADLIKVAEDAIVTALTTRRIKVGADWIVKRLNVDEAADARDALLKTIYSRMFDRVVLRVNESIQVGTKTKTNSIGVLDIFGFEVFDFNSFEQLCINYANETLQQQFNQFVFKLEQKEYEKEKIKWSFIDFPDNQQCLDLIESKPIGIISLLDEQCLFPRGNDRSLAGRFYELLSDVPRFSVANRDRVNYRFTIEHYAGDVTYDTAGFVAKNKDQLYPESLELMQSSQDPFLALLFPTEMASAGAGRNNGRSIQSKTLGSQFKDQLSDLLKTIRSTSPHYVRCLKPNDRAAANVLVRRRLVDQLRYGGVLEAVKVARAGYPVRMVLASFVARYFMVAPRRSFSSVAKAKAEQDGKPATLKIVEALQLEEGQEYQIGRTKIFLRKGAYERIEDARMACMKQAATRIQALLRAAKDRKHYIVSLRSAYKIQAIIRGFLGRARARHMREEKSATTIQAAARRRLAVKSRLVAMRAIVTMQCSYRAYKNRLLRRERLRDSSVLRIQAWYRGLPARRSFLARRKGVMLLQQAVRRKLARAQLKRLREEARQVGNLQGKISDLQTRVQDLETELAQEKEAHEALKQATEGSSGAQAGLAEELAQAKTRIAELEAEIADLREAAAQAQTQVSAPVAPASSPPPYLSASSADTDALQAQCDAQAREIEALRAQLAAASTSSARAMSNREIGLFEDKEGEEMHIGTVSTKANEQDGDIVAAQEADIRRLTETVARLEGDLAKANGVSNGGDNAAGGGTGASGEVEALLRAQIEELQNKLEEAEASSNRGRRTSDVSAASRRDLVEETVDTDGEHPDADPTPPDARMDALQKEVSALSEEKDEVLAQLREFTERMMDAENRANTYQNDAVALRKANRELYDKLQSMETLSDQASSVKIKLARRLEGLILENRTLRQEMNDYESTIARLTQENRLLTSRR
ncbi:Myosin-6 [Hondaea fermentalgiana]|uniref:Myosin-6 n=1 Tax=Hondaea fermentalgiana TaxID=2315210 RepID=A0A2R5H1V2_9STRA|nr:Myosin-6 [Hondaea fermentalgiana]|eukprot:GBG34344.1 Myosin-6 [Hondaea fermentalgiana]